nr:cupin domain-containing protein [uncultured Clostridium sp.]
MSDCNFIINSSCDNRSYYSWDDNDYGPSPLILNINYETIRNPSFRTTRWTGQQMQLTFMSIPVGYEIGAENHPNEDQYICVIDGDGMICMGDSPYDLFYSHTVDNGCAILIPFNTWHNLINTGDRPLKIYCIYAPVVHRPDTVHWTKRDSDKEN